MLEDIDNELEGVCRVERLDTLLKLILLHQFEVEDVIDEADEKIDLGHHHEYNSALCLVIRYRKQTLQHHELCREGGSKLVRHFHLVQGKYSILLLLSLKYLVEVGRDNSVSYIVKVDCYCLLLQEIYAFYSNLKVFFKAIILSSL